MTSQSQIVGRSQSGQPSVTPEGSLWYDTSNDILKASDGSAYNQIGKTSFAASAVITHSTTIGDYATPSTAIVSGGTNNTSTIGSTALNVGAGNANCRACKVTGLTAGDLINSVEFNIQTAVGNGRLKVYQDDGASGAPSTLLAESGSFALATGWNVQTMTNCSVPASGNVWVAFEFDTDGSFFYYAAGAAGDMKFVAHTFGTGPSPFGAISDSTEIANIRVNAAGSGRVFDDNTSTTWTSNTAANPYVYIDSGSAQNMCALAIYLNASTTETEIKIRVSTSTTFAASNVARTILVSNMTAGAWNYIRFNARSGRYIQVYGSSGSSKVLAISEIKYIGKTDALLFQDLGVLEISTSDTSLALDGT